MERPKREKKVPAHLTDGFYDANVAQNENRQTTTKEQNEYRKDKWGDSDVQDRCTFSVNDAERPEASRKRKYKVQTYPVLRTVEEQEEYDRFSAVVDDGDGVTSSRNGNATKGLSKKPKPFRSVFLEESEHTNGKMKRMKREITYRELTKYFHLQMSEAAEILQLHQTQLQRHCRRVGILKWPNKEIHKRGLKQPYPSFSIYNTADLNAIEKEYVRRAGFSEGQNMY